MIASLDITIERRSHALPVTIANRKLELIVFVSAVSRHAWQVDFFRGVYGEIFYAFPIIVRHAVVDVVLAPKLSIRMELVPGKQALHHLGCCFMPLVDLSFGSRKVVHFSTEWNQGASKFPTFAVSSLPSSWPSFS